MTMLIKAFEGSGASGICVMKAVAGESITVKL